MEQLSKKERVAALIGIGVSRPYAYHLVNGIRRPSLPLAMRIERELGIPAESWLEPRTERAA
jgi:transcriptional regulator with XRE-family HTH domain